MCLKRGLQETTRILVGVLWYMYNVTSLGGLLPIPNFILVHNPTSTLKHQLMTYLLDVKYPAVSPRRVRLLNCCCHVTRTEVPSSPLMHCALELKRYPTRRFEVARSLLPKMDDPFFMISVELYLGGYFYSNPSLVFLNRVKEAAGFLESLNELLYDQSRF